MSIINYYFTLMHSHQGSGEELHVERDFAHDFLFNFHAYIGGVIAFNGGMQSLNALRYHFDG